MFLFFLKKVEISHTDEDLGIKLIVSEDKPIREEDICQVINIALFSLDKRGPYETGRSDSIMIASLGQNRLG